MNEEQRLLLIQNIKNFFRKEIVNSHIEEACKRASVLKSYNVHPFLLKYLANFLEGNDSPESIAKALIYPRLLGTSITTIFGNKAQKMMGTLFQGFGSVVSGIDIEYIDPEDGRRKYCQVKAGPNTINKDDIKTISDHFQAVKNLARTNHLDVRFDDLVVGIIYGGEKNLSNHYKKISAQYPVYVGANFWYRLTGRASFYNELIDAIGEIAVEVDGREKLQEAITLLAKNIQENPDALF
jgi:hypothetical protein